MTTYPGRTKKIQWTLKSLFNQTAKVDRIILWLAKEQYLQGEIPKEIKKYEKYGLEVKFCNDLKSHKKYYYSMLQNPNAIVITVDDDVIYPEDTIEKLLSTHERFPKAVVCNMGRWISCSGKIFESYKKWSVNIPQEITKPTFRILPIGEGGVLYPPHSIDKECFNVNGIKKNAFTADDLWLKYAEVRCGTKAMITKSNQKGMCQVLVKGEKNIGLNSMNVTHGMNDQVIAKLNKKYPKVYEIIKRQ